LPGSCHRIPRANRNRRRPTPTTRQRRTSPESCFSAADPCCFFQPCCGLHAAPCRILNCRLATVVAGWPVVAGWDAPAGWCGFAAGIEMTHEASAVPAGSGWAESRWTVKTNRWRETAGASPAWSSSFGVRET
jgi:hypothetical protein